VLLNKDWVYNNVPKFAQNNNVKYDIEEAPDILELEDNEKFTDADGNVLDIETRGERDMDNIYFKVKDVGKFFEMKRLQDVVLDKNKNYKVNIHYKYFYLKKTTNSGKIKVKKELFFTYTGLVRCLYVSKNKHVDKFQKWASNVLFTAQMGTSDQKDELVSKILGVSARAVKEVFKTSSTTIPCIYLFSLNSVKKLRKKMKIDDKYTDDMLVCKYGFTKNLSRRTSEHIKDFCKIKKVNLKLKHHSYIDPKYISDAESDIRDFFQSLDIELKYKKYDELVIIKPSLFKIVKNQYLQLSNAYAGHIKELIVKVEDLKKELILKDKDIELIKEKHKNELLAKDNEIITLKKDLEIEQLKLQLA
jgi:hypothetical protein